MTMKDHLTDTQIQGFRQSKLDGAQLLLVSDHLAACNFCRERAIPNGVLSLKIAHLQQDFQRHLTDEELMSWADAEKVEDPEFVEGHLEGCPSCRQELAELHAFQARLKPKVRSKAPFAWVGIAAAIVIVALVVTQKRTVPSPP